MLSFKTACTVCTTIPTTVSPLNEWKPELHRKTVSAYIFCDFDFFANLDDFNFGAKSLKSWQNQTNIHILFQIGSVCFAGFYNYNLTRFSCVSLGFPSFFQGFSGIFPHIF